MELITHTRLLREWFGRFSDRCQVFVGGPADQSVGTWLSGWRELLAERPHHFSGSAYFTLQSVLTKIVIKATRLSNIQTEDALNIVGAIAIATNARELFDTLDKQLLRLESGVHADHVDVPLGVDRRVNAVINLISERSAEPDLSLDSIALVVRLSPSYLSRLLSRRSGHTFEFYLHEARVRQSMVLLADLTLSIKEISHLVGYRSTTQLDRHFKLSCGMSPRFYRMTIR